MAPKAKATKKKLPQAPLSKTTKLRVERDPRFEKKARNFRIGGDIQPKKDLTRYVRWPKYIRLQRMKRILLQRLKVPPSINQFNMPIARNEATQVIKLFKKYQPETRAEKKQRLLEQAKAKESGKDLALKKPMHIKYGLNHITELVEDKKAKLVVIAHDVEPIETICWLPALCRKKDVPYCIIKGRARLGQLVHQKNATSVALTNVRKEDMSELENLCKNFRAQFNENTEIRRKWGGGIMGIKSQHVTQRKEKILAIEQAKKMGLQL